MRGFLVVNPQATTTSARTRDVLVHALAAEHDIDVVETSSRGHAFDLGRLARAEGADLVVTLGGDGTVNEVVNGMLADGGPDHDVPALAAVPGGSANVFPRSLGLPPDPVEATGILLEAMREKRERTIGLGRVDERWFLFNAGLGLDAEIIHAMERKRADGKPATPGRYLGTTLAEFFRGTDRRNAALTLHRPGLPDVEGIFVALVQNTSPWTFLGPWPVDPCPRASYDTGLDLFAPRSLSVLPALRYSRRMITHSRAGSTRRGLVSLHDQVEFTLSASRPMALQVDGEGLGDVHRVTLRSVPAALRVIV
jgi:diacylglycerol kinase family enzyme